MQICGFLITFWYIGTSYSRYFLLAKSFILKIHTKASTVTSQVKVSSMNFSSSSLLHTSSRICQLHFFCFWTGELPLNGNTLGSGMEPGWPSSRLAMLTKRATHSFPCQLHIVIWFASILISYFLRDLEMVIWSILDRQFMKHMACIFHGWGPLEQRRLCFERT